MHARQKKFSAGTTAALHGAAPSVIASSFMDPVLGVDVPVQDIQAALDEAGIAVAGR